MLHAERLHQHKGTYLALSTLFSWIGFDAISFEEQFDTSFGFDNALGFDAENRKLDGKCSKCVRLNISMSHSQLNEELMSAVQSIIAWGVPANVQVFVYYNGEQAGIFDDTFDDTFN